ncbi:MAG TPA: 5-formyltetrahydrofolate cyclo-ligase [Methylocella sp.]|nr:5-formyltetrahydrofolate cyclo-ligase [Methylocella sp.]
MARLSGAPEIAKVIVVAFTPLSKSSLRAEGMSRRRGISPEAATLFASYLAEQGAALACRLRPKTVSAYFPLPGEPSPLPLLANLSKAGFETALPVTGRLGTPLVFRLWRPGEPTAAGKMKIAEPLPSAPEVRPDLLFVPLAAFDRSGHRLGYGAGFYDRTLAALRAQKPIYAVGIGYAAQEFATIPHEPHDERLDYVQTDRELIACRASS